MRAVLMGLILMLALPFGARTIAAEGPSPPRPVTFRLANGLEVIFVEAHGAPTVAIDVWYRVGGANDPPGRSGFAHLFEHLMFQGSANVPPGGHLQMVSRAGGDANASTMRDFTNYYEALPSNQLPLGLWLEAERMRSLVVDEDNFRREREVVKEEYRQSYQNQPYGEASLLLQTMPFAYQPYRQAVIGSVEDLDRATIDEVRAFHAAYYRPNNAILAVGGDVDPAQTRELIEQYFGDIRPGEPPPSLPPVVLTRSDRTEPVTIEDDLARVPALVIGYVLPPAGDSDTYAAEVLSYVLSGGGSSRLARTLTDPGLAAQASASVIPYRGPSLFGVTLVPNEGVPLERLAGVYDEDLERIRARGVEPSELEKVVNQIRTAKIDGLQTALGLTESVQGANAYLGDPNAYLDDLERYRGVTSDDIRRVAERYLSTDDRFVITVVPASGGAP